MKMEVLKALSVLKGKSDYDTIYINNDRTEAEINNEINNEQRFITLRVNQLERNNALKYGSGYMKFDKHMCSDGTERN